MACACKFPPVWRYGFRVRRCAAPRNDRGKARPWLGMTRSSQRKAARWLMIFFGAGRAFFCLSRPSKNMRARGTPGPSRTHGPQRLAAPWRPGREPGLLSSLPQVRHISSVPRAVFRGLLRTTPGGLTFQAPSPFRIFSGSSAYPPLWDLAKESAGELRPRTCRPRPVMRGWRIGTVRLGPPRFGCTSSHPCAATAPRWARRVG